MNKISPERQLGILDQLNILDHLEEMSKKLNTFHQCTVYVDFLEDLKYVKELVKRDIGLPVVREEKVMLFSRCPKCNTIVDHYRIDEINYCKMCGQALYELKEWLSCCLHFKANTNIFPH